VRGVEFSKVEEGSCSTNTKAGGAHRPLYHRPTIYVMMMCM